MNATNDDISNRLRASLGSHEAPQLSADLVTGAAERPAPHIVHPARRAVAAGGLTLAAAATVVAVAIGAPGQQGPLFTAAGSGGNALAATEDARMMIWTNYEYVAGDGLSTSSGSGHVYQLQRTGTADEVLRTTAEALGVPGEPGKSAYFDEAYPSYVIGPEDGTGPSVVVSWIGTGDWWYNNPAAYPQFECNSEGVCEQPEPGDNLAPSAAEARTLAQQIFAETGFEVSEDAIRVVADEWQTSATASLFVEGTQTALEWGVSWSPSGLISYAYGHSVTVVDKGSYDTVSAHDAVSRLADWRWFGAAGPEFQGGMHIMTRDAVAFNGETDEGADGDVDVDEPVEGEAEEAPSDDPTIEPAPEPEPTLIDPIEPETVTVTVEEATATLLLVWDAEGNAWLVPGFAMPHPDGWFNSVISLIEGVIALPEPIATEDVLF